MKVLNTTPFPFGPLAGRMPFPGHSATLIVKATFDLAPDQKAEPADEPRHLSGDEFFPGDEEMEGSPRYESDFAFLKPRADLLLAGTYHAPGGHATRSCEVGFTVGERSKRLLVTGDRRWRGPMGLGRMTDPVPFERLELCYERAFGGNGHKANPVGIGYGKEQAEGAPSSRPVPNIEDPRNTVGSRASRPTPAGFGPRGKLWKDRSAYLGTYKKKWLKTRWPWFPEDFDFAHFNAAPPDMQVEGYLRGDERLAFENLHPEHPHYESRLPGVRVRCFIDEKVEPEASQEIRFREVPMNLDTLWADMDAEQVVLVWRGISDVRSEEFEEVEAFFILAEDLEDAPATLEACHARYLEALEAEEAELEDEEPIEAVSGEAPAVDQEPPPDPRMSREALEAGVLSLLAGVGAGAAVVSEEAKQLLDYATEKDPDKLAEMDQQATQKTYDEALRNAGLDPDDLPPPSREAQREQVRMLKELGVEDAEATVMSPETALLFSTLAAVMPRVGVDPTNLTSLIDKVKKIPGFTLPETPEPAPIAEGRIRPLTREIVEAEAAAGESFAKEDFSGLDLSELDLAGLDFTEADFTGARLAGADLTGALLVEVNLDAADLCGAKLEAAVVTGARGSQCNFEGACLDLADLTDADLPDANMTGASFSETVFDDARLANLRAEEAAGAGVRFSGAQLTGARFAKSDLSGADFSGAALQSANFRGANLSDAAFQSVQCLGADFREADLTKFRAADASDFSGSSFYQVRGGESIWEEVVLNEADFSHAEMKGALFMRSTMQKVNLYATEMTGARFMKDDLSDAQIRDMNLFEGSFEKSNLTRADLRGSNLYAVEFLGAELKDAQLAGANVKMSKLA